MKTLSVVAGIVALLSSAPAFASSVSMTFQNVGTATMVPNGVNTCGVFAPTPANILAGATSPTSSTNCGTTSAAHVTYKIGTKQCVFHISTIYTPANPLTGASAYWTPNASTTASGSATCKVVSQDISQIFTNGNFAAVFSMK